MSGSLYNAITSAESSNTNAAGPFTSSGQAEGFYQITTGTWQDYAPGAGVNLSQYPDPLSAPYGVQTQVANTIPLSRWASSTVQAVQNLFGGTVDPSQTLGQIAAGLGQNPGLQGIGGASPTGSSAGGASPSAGGGSGSCGLSPACWLGALGDWAGGYASRAGLILLAIILLIGGVMLFAMRTQIVQEMPAS